MGKPEANLGTRVDEWFRKQPDIFCFNVHGNHMQRRGIPDRVGTVGPVGFWIELKKPGNGPTPIQSGVHRKIARAGGNVRVCRSLAEVQEFIEELRVMALDRAGAFL